MSFSSNSKGSLNAGLFFARVPLGFTFLLFGIMKVFRIGVGDFVAASSRDIPRFLPHPIGQTYLYALPFAEIIVGCCLILGFFSRTAGLIASLMLLSFVIAKTGVFDGGDKLHLQYNIVYLGIALLIALVGSGGVSLDRMIWGKVK